MKKVAFHNLGCKVNSYELDGISQMFQNRGYEIVDFAQKADIYIVNTCTVTNIADHKSRQMLGRARAQNPDAIVVATGCYVQNDPEGVEANDAVDIAVGNNHKSEIVDIVEEYMAASVKTLSGMTVSDLKSKCSYEELPVSKTSGHTRAYIKIQDGCDQFCSYCVIPFARGRSRSRAFTDIIDEAKRLSQNGYREVVLTGIHISSYGLDDRYNRFVKDNNTNEELIRVIEGVAAIDGIERVRLSSLEPQLMTDDLIGRLAGIRKLCPHFHMSLQSGSDTVLARMNRHYSSARFEEKVTALRNAFEHPAITTDIIVGFPAETEAEFEQTRDFLNRVRPYECHVFKYSRRRGTNADKMEGQLTDAVKSARSAILIGDSNRRKREFAEYYIGKKVKVLAEDTVVIDGRKYSAGLTPEYVRVSMPLTKSGEIIEVRISDDPGSECRLYNN